MQTRTILALVLVIVGATSLDAAAQGVYGYGTIVNRADYDYSPMAIGLAAASLCTIDANGNAVYDAGEALYLNTHATTCPTLTTWDLRLTPSGSLGAGTPVQVGDPDHNVPLLAVANDILRTYDGDGSADFNSKDTLYVDIVGANFRVDVGDLRLTKFGSYPAGSVVKAGDADVSAVLVEMRTGQTNRLSTVGIVYQTGGSLGFKKDRSLYINVDNGAIQAANGDLGVEANDVRLSATFAAPWGSNPDIKPFNLAFTPSAPVAGKPFQVSVEVRNDGKGLSAGLISTKVANNVVDARMSPVLAPGEKATLVMTLVAPDAAGPATVTVGDVNIQVPVEAPASARATAEVTTLQQQVGDLQAKLASSEAAAKSSTERAAGLEARIAALERPPTMSATSATGATATSADLGPAKQAPGFEAVALLALGAFVALAKRRRSP